MENVVALRYAMKEKGKDVGPPNLDVCVHRLRTEVNFNVVTLQLDPRMFGYPCSRGRLYMLCVRQCVLDKAGVSHAEFLSIASGTITKLVGVPAIPIDELILEDSHTLVTRDHGRKHRAAEDVSTETPQTRGAWPLKHASACGDEWWKPSPFRAANALEQYPGLAELCPRHIDLLEHFGIGLPEKHPCTVDLNPSLGRTRAVLYNNKAPCLSVGSRLYLGHRARYACGVEHMRLMGFMIDNFDVEILTNFNSDFLRDLAGNAFDAASYMAASTTMWVTLGELYLRASGAGASIPASKEGTISLGSLWGAGGGSDSDDE